MRPRCPICTSSFVANDFSLLQCGHAFHLPCILQWLEQSKTCPNCRVRTTDRQIIRQVFFDYADQSTLNESNVVEEKEDRDSQRELTARLEREHSEHCKTKEQLIAMGKSKAKAEALLTREQTQSRAVPALRERVVQLEMMLQDQQHLREQLEQSRNRLRASQFYQLLMNSSTKEADEAIDRFLGTSGDIESAKFLSLVRRQLDETKKQLTESVDRCRSSEQMNCKLEKRNAELKRMVRALRDEQLHNRAHATPHNPALKPLLAIGDETSPGIGFTFGDCDPFAESMLESALRTRPTPSASTVFASEKPPPFPHDEIENCEPQLPSTSHDRGVGISPGSATRLSSRLDLDETVEIPQAIRGRVLFGGSPRKISDGMGGVRREGLTTKERIAANRPTAPPPARQKHKNKSTSSVIAGNRRISHFFARIPSSSDFNDEITIDD